MEREPWNLHFNPFGETEYEKLSEISHATLQGIHEAFATHLLQRGRVEPYALDRAPGYMEPRSLTQPLDTVVVRELFYRDQPDVTVMPNCFVSYESPHFMDADYDRRVVSTTLVSLKIAVGNSGVFEERCYHFIEDHSRGELSATIDVAFTSREGTRVDTVLKHGMDEEEQTLDLLAQQAALYRPFTQSDVEDLGRLLRALSGEGVERVS